MSSVRTPETSVCGASCGATIPITWHHCSLSLMYSPTAGAAPKRLSLAAAPRTHTGAAAAFSGPSKKRPSVTRRAFLNVGNILSNDLIVVERQARRIYPYFLQFLIIVRFLGLHDEIANAELFDESHDLLLRSSSNGEHRHNRCHAKNHAQHGQEGTQLVAGQVLEPEDKIGQPLLQGSWLGYGAGLHRYALGFNWNPDPGWDSGCHRSCCCR